MPRQSIDDAILDLEKSIQIHKFVKDSIPDARVLYIKKNQFKGFVSKYVNSQYSHIEFIDRYQKVYVAPYLELEYTFNNKPEKIRVYSSPRQTRLVYMRHNYHKRKNIICFSRLTFNIKNNNFKDDMLSACRMKIMNFIKSNPNCELDQTHLDPKLQKLLIFN
jgi:hypothetical protein